VIHSIKGFMSFKTFYRALRDHGGLELSTEAVIHMRIATHGAINSDNCHPFSNDEVVFYHNGILSKFGSKDLSDSRDFFNRVLSKLDHETRLLVADEFANPSKFCIIQEGKVNRVGNWTEKDKLWMSNTNHCAWGSVHNRYGTPGMYGGQYHGNNRVGFKSYLDDDDDDDKFLPRKTVPKTEPLRIDIDEINDPETIQNADLDDLYTPTEAEEDLGFEAYAAEYEEILTLIDSGYTNESLEKLGYDPRVINEVYYDYHNEDRSKQLKQGDA
jgi:hypothetical protein